MNDLISRQAAIDALADMHCKSDEDGYVWIIRSDAWARIDALPSAQPEITHCAECLHWKHSAVRKSYCEVFDWVNTADDFCSFAERRKGEGNL